MTTRRPVADGGGHELCASPLTAQDSRGLAASRLRRSPCTSGAAPGRRRIAGDSACRAAGARCARLQRRDLRRADRQRQACPAASFTCRRHGCPRNYRHLAIPRQRTPAVQVSRSRDDRRHTSRYHGSSRQCGGNIATAWCPQRIPAPHGRQRPSQGITAGPDGNIWFTELNGNKVVKIDPANPTVITSFTLPTANSQPWGITAGADHGNLWLTANSMATGWAGSPQPAYLSEFQIPTANSSPLGITAGPYGYVWFVQKNSGQVGKIVPPSGLNRVDLLATGPGPMGSRRAATATSGSPRRTATRSAGSRPPASSPSSRSPPPQPPIGITAGPDGNLWFTESTPATRSAGSRPRRRRHRVPRPRPPTALPGGITAGPDGNLWFTEAGGQPDRAHHDRGARITEFTSADRRGPPVGDRAGPDGNLWFTEYERQPDRR